MKTNQKISFNKKNKISQKIKNQNIIFYFQIEKLPRSSHLISDWIFSSQQGIIEKPEQRVCIWRDKKIDIFRIATTRGRCLTWIFLSLLGQPTSKLAHKGREKFGPEWSISTLSHRGVPRVLRHADMSGLAPPPPDRCSERTSRIERMFNWRNVLSLAKAFIWREFFIPGSNAKNVFVIWIVFHLGTMRIISAAWDVQRLYSLQSSVQSSPVSVSEAQYSCDTTISTISTVLIQLSKRFVWQEDEVRWI